MRASATEVKRMKNHNDKTITTEGASGSLDALVSALRNDV